MSLLDSPTPSIPAHFRPANSCHLLHTSRLASAAQRWRDHCHVRRVGLALFLLAAAAAFLLHVRDGDAKGCGGWKADGSDNSARRVPWIEVRAGY